MCCLETKVKIDKSASVSQKINKNWSWVFNYDHHSNGRLWVGWDPNLWQIGVLSSSDQHITCSVMFLEKRLNFICTFLYALNKPHQRQSLWNDILTLSSTINMPWCVSGDFNCVLSLNEVEGG